MYLGADPAASQTLPQMTGRIGNGERQHHAQAIAQLGYGLDHRIPVQQPTAPKRIRRGNLHYLRRDIARERGWRAFRHQYPAIKYRQVMAAFRLIHEVRRDQDGSIAIGEFE